MSFSDRAKDLLGRMIHSEISTVEAAGLANSVASVAVSFDSGLLPRTLPQQGVLTGLWGVSTYAMTATVQSFVEATVRRVSRDRLSSTQARRAGILAADAAVIGTGLALQKAFPRRTDEPLVRAAMRSAGWRLTLSGASGVTAITVDTVHDTVTRDHDDYTVNTMMTVVAGSAVAGGMYLWRSRTLIDTGVERDQYGQDVAGSVRRLPWAAAAIGPAVTLALLGISRAERWAARTVGQGICFLAPSTAPYATAIGHALTLGAITVGAGRGISFVYHTTEVAGDAIEAAYSQVPDSPYVSGSPSASGEDWTTFGREGRRYVNMAMTAQEVSDVIGREAIDPIRAYVGLGTDVSPNRRAARAMSELDRLGAFERDYIAIFFPTGTGYVNYVALEALEYFTAGNVASVTIQYSVRPSFLSLGEVGTARESNLLLLNRLSERLRHMPEGRRPKVLLFGESLGSLGGQDVLVPEGTDDLDVLAIDGALFIGTPYASKWRQRWLADPAKVDPDGIVVEVQGIDEWNALPSEQRARTRVVLLTHNNDPIPKFGAPLIIQEPDWLGPADERPPGVPRHTVFIPGLTFLTTAIDLLNSEHVKPGIFEAFGHDYRFDLAEMVRAAYHLDVPDETVAAVEAALRQREVVWAERRLITETLAQAEGKIRKTVSGWGIDSGSVPNIVEPQRDVATDPYAAAEPEASVEA